jgi:hypothetical protein
VERLFSVAGQLLTDRRNRLGSESLRALLFLDSIFTDEKAVSEEEYQNSLLALEDAE